MPWAPPQQQKSPAEINRSLGPMSRANPVPVIEITRTPSIVATPTAAPSFLRRNEAACVVLAPTSIPTQNGVSSLAVDESSIYELDASFLEFCNEISSEVPEQIAVPFVEDDAVNTYLQAENVTPYNDDDAWNDLLFDILDDYEEPPVAYAVPPQDISSEMTLRRPSLDSTTVPQPYTSKHFDAFPDLDSESKDDVYDSYPSTKVESSIEPTKPSSSQPQEWFRKRKAPKVTKPIEVNPNRKKATSMRERENGKFARRKIKWLSVTEVSPSAPAEK